MSESAKNVKIKRKKNLTYNFTLASCLLVNFKEDLNGMLIKCFRAKIPNLQKETPKGN